MENKNYSKSKVDFIFSSPAKLHRDNIEAFAFLDQYVADRNREAIIATRICIRTLHAATDG